jgi:hypothetical protein
MFLVVRNGTLRTPPGVTDSVGGQGDQNARPPNDLCHVSSTLMIDAALRAATGDRVAPDPVPSIAVPPEFNGTKAFRTAEPTLPAASLTLRVIV